MPLWMGSPAVAQAKSFKRNGTPRKGPGGKVELRAWVRAFSKSGVITALSCGLTFSIRAIAASTSSSGVTSPLRTSSAWAVASKRARSVAMTPPFFIAFYTPPFFCSVLVSFRYHLCIGKVKGLRCFCVRAVWHEEKGQFRNEIEEEVTKRTNAQSRSWEDGLLSM